MGDGRKWGRKAKPATTQADTVWSPHEPIPKNPCINNKKNIITKTNNNFNNYSLTSFKNKVNKSNSHAFQSQLHHTKVKIRKTLFKMLLNGATISASALGPSYSTLSSRPRTIRLYSTPPAHKVPPLNWMDLKNPKGVRPSLSTIPASFSATVTSPASPPIPKKHQCNPCFNRSEDEMSKQK